MQKGVRLPKALGDRLMEKANYLLMGLDFAVVDECTLAYDEEWDVLFGEESAVDGVLALVGWEPTAEDTIYRREDELPSYVAG
jgi:hypothetical protein